MFVSSCGYEILPNAICIYFGDLEVMCIEFATRSRTPIIVNFVISNGRYIDYLSLNYATNNNRILKVKL